MEPIKKEDIEMLEPLTVVTLLSTIGLAIYSAFSKIRIDSDPEFDLIEPEIKKWLKMRETTVPFNAESDEFKFPVKPTVKVPRFNASTGIVQGSNYSASGGE